jgi:hypothetical protein
MVQELWRVIDRPCRPFYTARRIPEQPLCFTREDEFHVLFRRFSTFNAFMIVPDFGTRRSHHSEKRELGRVVGYDIPSSVQQIQIAVDCPAC